MSASPLQLKAWRPCGPGKAGADEPVDRFASAISPGRCLSAFFLLPVGLQLLLDFRFFKG